MVWGSGRAAPALAHPARPSDSPEDLEGPAAKATTDHFWATQSPRCVLLAHLLDTATQTRDSPPGSTWATSERRLFQVQGLVLSPP